MTVTYVKGDNNLSKIRRVIRVSKLDVVLGDALFAVDIDLQRMWPSKKWQDTPHFHVDNEIHIILSDSALIEIDGKDVQMTAGDICLLAPNSSHYPKKFGEGLEKANLSFSLMKNYVVPREKRTFSEYSYYSALFGSVDEYFVINDDELTSIVKKLIGEQYSSETEHVFTSLLSVFFITLAKRIKEHHPPYNERTVRRVTESENTARQRKIVEEFFQKRYSEEISIDDLAKDLCLSVPHTHRVVKKVFESGFKKTLMKQRIDHACMLIKQNDLPLSEIAYRCGYTSYNGFLSAFKSYMGKTPKEYEKSIR